jgi:RNA polymerase sigma-70 factor, ECF subfamily
MTSLAAARGSGSEGLLGTASPGAAGTTPAPAADADEAVVARVLAGDTEAFALLVRRYQAPLFRTAMALVLDRDTAADLVQDAFVRAYRHLDTCRDPARVGAWLFRTLRHRCLDHLKEARRRDVRLDAVAPPADPAGGPDAIVQRAELRRALKRALAQLPLGQREALLLRTVEGLSYETMADRLGVSVSALKMRVLRARETLAAALGRDTRGA